MSGHDVVAVAEAAFLVGMAAGAVLSLLVRTLAAKWAR